MLFVLLFKHRKHPHLMKKKTFISKPVDNIFVYFSIVKKKFNLNFVFFCSFTRQIMKRSKTYLLLCLSHVNKSKDFLYKWFVSFLYRSLHAPFKVKSRVSKSHLGILVVFLERRGKFFKVSKYAAWHKWLWWWPKSFGTDWKFHIKHFFNQFTGNSDFGDWMLCGNNQ